MDPTPAPRCGDCESQDIFLTKGRRSYCRACWKYNCEFKFRKRLFEFGRPARGTAGEVFKPTEQVLIVYDGSPSSVALINLAVNARLLAKIAPRDSNNPNLPFPFRFVVLVIVESELNGSPGVEGRQKKHLHSLLKWTKTAEKMSDGIPIPLLVTCLEMSIKEYHPPEANNYMRLDDSPLVLRLVESASSADHVVESLKDVKNTEVDALAMPFNESLDYHLMEIRRSLKSKTEDKDFITILKRNLVNTIADHLQISKVVLPEDQTSLAVKMFTMMSLGRGVQVADEMSFISPGPEERKTCRPFIDFSDDELKSYLDTLGEESTEALVNKGAKRKMKIDSVERQCDDFIVNLQRGYPATVSTLTRIGGKLQPSTNSDSSKATRCQFCKRQTDSLNSNTLQETNLCYGCQHFLNDAHPDKKELFRNLFTLRKSQQTSSS